MEEIDLEEVSDTIPIELLQAEGIDIDLGPIYPVEIDALESTAGSYGRPRLNSLNNFKRTFKNVRRRLSVSRSSVSSFTESNTRVVNANESRRLNSDPTEIQQQSGFIFRITRFFSSFYPASRSTNNPRFRGREKRYNERSYSDHWFNFCIYGLNESGALIPWLIVLLFLPSWLSIPLPWINSILVSIGWVYIFLGIPQLIGFIFAQLLRRLGPLHMYPFEVGAVHISPMIYDWKIRVRLTVLDAKFGNPPHFPFPYFLECGRLDIDASVSLADLANTIQNKKTESPLSKVPDFKYLMKIDFDHIEVADAMVNFQMYEGRFNINEFTRILAEGEAKHVLGKDPFPNQLHVSILRAKNLKPHRLKRTIDPYVVVRVRRNCKTTATQTETMHPMFNEDLIFNLDDPSVVMEIAVYDRDSPDGSQAAFIGHWAMTTKYLVTNPNYNFHIPEDYRVYKHKNLTKMSPFKKATVDDESDIDDDADLLGIDTEEDNFKSPSYRQLGFRGWIPLAAKNWERMGEVGQLEVKIVWKHVHPTLLRSDDFVEKRQFTALEQLTQQSAEDQLRFGAWSRVKHWLNHEPFCYDIKRFTIRRTKFYLQDLFRGHKGKAEHVKKRRKGKVGVTTLGANNDSIQVAKETSGHIPIAFLEMTERFRPKKGDIGVTTYHVFLNFFVGLVYEFARRGKTGKALAEIMSGGFFNFKSSIAKVVKGEASLSAKEGMEKLLKQTSAGFQVLHQKVTINRLNAAQFKFPVDAYDTDFLLNPDEIEINGYLDRATVKVKRQISKEKMVKLSKGWNLKFKPKYFEIKGETLFYRKHEAFQQDKVYHLTYKLKLHDIQSILYLATQQLLVLNVEMHDHCVILRAPKNALGRTRSLQKWLQIFAEHGIPCTEH